MQKPLSKKDIKDLKYQCRMGYIIPFFFFTIGTIPVSALILFIFNSVNVSLDDNYKFIIIVIMFILSIFMVYKMNGKYISDIKNNVKILESKTIQRKESNVDFEAGSGNMTTLPHNRPMNKFIRYDLIIENTRYRIDKELYEKCTEGEEVYFHIAPKSKFRLSIESK